MLNSVTLLTITSLCLATYSEQSTVCNLTVVNTDTQTPAQTFQIYKSRGIHFVKFHLSLKNVSSTVPLSIKQNDTFDPSLWIWATQVGKYMLRLPLDAELLSFGLLSFHEADMDITVTESSEGCLSQQPADTLWNTIGLLLMESVVFLNSSALGDELVCRSTYTFQHYFYSHIAGVGYKCCLNNDRSSNNSISCDSAYNDGWQLVWVGPLCILAIIYLMVVLSLYSRLKTNYTQMVKGFLVIEKFIDNLKEDLILNIEKTGCNMQLAHSPRELLSFHEKVFVMDALGVSKQFQARLSNTVRVITIVLFFALYYGYFGFCIYYYWKEAERIKLLQRSSDVYVNVFGHSGWIFGQTSLNIQKYGIFEAVITATVPIFTVFNYWSFNLQRTVQNETTSKKLKDINENDCDNKINSSFTDGLEQQRRDSLMIRLLDSLPGRVIQLTTFIIVLLYVVVIASVYIVYCLFFIFLGLFVSLDILGTWLIPLMIFIYYVTVAFNPLIEFYKTIKQKLFEICREEQSEMLISQTREIFLPRKLLDDFYQPRSREVIFATIQKILLATALLVLMFIVLFYVQYPSMNLSTSGSSILGVNVVILLPFLAGSLSSNHLSEYELEILTYDLTKFIKTWTSDNHSSVKKPKKKTNKVSNSKYTQKVSKDTKKSGAGCNSDDVINSVKDNSKENIELETMMKGLQKEPLLE